MYFHTKVVAFGSWLFFEFDTFLDILFLMHSK